MQRALFLALVSFCAAGLASAQMKTRPTPPAQSPALPQNIPSGNPNVVVTTSAPDPSLARARRIERAEAQRLVSEGKAVFVDVRSEESYHAGHIKGALNIPSSQLDARLRELPPGKTLITYCA